MAQLFWPIPTRFNTQAVATITAENGHVFNDGTLVDLSTADDDASFATINASGADFYVEGALSAVANFLQVSADGLTDGFGGLAPTAMYPYLRWKAAVGTHAITVYIHNAAGTHNFYSSSVPFIGTGQWQHASISTPSVTMTNLLADLAVGDVVVTVTNSSSVDFSISTVGLDYSPSIGSNFADIDTAPVGNWVNFNPAQAAT